MRTKLSHTQLMIPVYINEKIVLDMLAIIEDGFSMVSQVNSSEQKESTTDQTGNVNASTSLLNKLLKIDLKGEISRTGNIEESENISREKVHTNVSLLSKFRTTLDAEKLLDTSSDISNMQIGSFIELEGELQKNPLIDYMEKIIDMFRMVDIFSDEPELGNKKNAALQKKEENKIIKQIKDFSSELKNSGTVDFILSSSKGTVVLSVQEQYLANDNISEILGGRFKVLGKVIAICKDNSASIDLLRKTTLSILTDEILEDIFGGFKNEDLQQFNLPELVTKINGPAMIVIPIAIYA
ncbi:MAG: hypothetical protein J1E98_12015 [Lachnospiraceae bacterium]|nr:hypothetical protein [Lachnospiraceae bacterium]